MEHTNRFLPSLQPDGNERRSMMDPRAWLLKVAIVRIELQQKDPTLSIRSLLRIHNYLFFWGLFDSALGKLASSTGDRVYLALEMVVLDAFSLYQVRSTVEKNDNLREVFNRAARSTRKALLHATSTLGAYGSCKSSLNFVHCILTHHCLLIPGSKQKCVDLDSELAIAHTLRAFLTSVFHLLTSVFQYLTGCVDRGGPKTYSFGAFDFRDNFVSLVLFQGAYIWIKFRQADPHGSRKRKAPDVVDIEGCNLKGVHKRSIKNSSGALIRSKYEPRFTPPRQEGDDGTNPCSRRQLPLGEYYTPVEAQIVRQIARYYYDKDGGCVELEDGRYKFLIPPMSEQERRLAGQEKRTWISCRAKQLGNQMYVGFQREKGKQLAMATEAGSHGAECNDPSSSALPLACSSLPMLTTMAAKPAIGSAAASSPSLPLLPFDGAGLGDAYDFSESLSGIEDMIAVLLRDPGSPNLPDQPSSVVSYQVQYQGFAQLVGNPSLLEVGAVPEGVDHDSQPELNTSPSFQQGRILADAGTENIDGRIFLQQSDPVLQQVVFCQKCLGDNARQFVHVDQLKAYEIQISKLQQEIESLKNRLQQVASLSSNLD